MTSLNQLLSFSELKVGNFYLIEFKDILERSTYDIMHNIPEIPSILQNKGDFKTNPKKCEC